MNVFGKLRENAGLTQQAAADAMKVDRSTVAKWETGVCMPNASKLPALAELYKCTIPDFYRSEEKNRNPKRGKAAGSMKRTGGAATR